MTKSERPFHKFGAPAVDRIVVIGSDTIVGIVQYQTFQSGTALEGDNEFMDLAHPETVRVLV